MVKRNKKSFFNECGEVFSRKATIYLTEEQCQILWNESEDFRKEYSKMGMDTYVREWLFDIFASYYLQCESWPSNGDPQEYKEEFKRRFLIVAKEQKIKYSKQVWKNW